jgi:hypothetical protein
MTRTSHRTPERAPIAVVEARCLVLEGWLPDTATVDCRFVLPMSIAAPVVFSGGTESRDGGLVAPDARSGRST